MSLAEPPAPVCDASAEPEYRVCIGICTRRRPGMLGRLLASLLRMDLPAGVAVSVCVVENDERPANRALVAGFDASAPFPVAYLQEPRVGIPQARNRLLEHAAQSGATALIFIDDDEEVVPDWLCRLCAYARAEAWQVVVQGRVISRLGPEAAGCRLEPYFQRKARPTGERLSSCASNNTLLPLGVLGEDEPWFDEGRPAEGGTDTIFFARLANLGVPIHYCQEAVVVETVPAERANLRYLSRRKFRVGLLLGSGSVQSKPRSAPRAFFYSLKGLASLLQAGLCALLWQRDAMIRAWLRCCRSFGCSLGYFRLRRHPYLKVEGF